MIESVILSSLIYNEDFSRRVIPHVKKEYFQQVGDQVTFKLIKDFQTKYNKVPSKEALLVDLDNSSLKETVFDSARKTINSLKQGEYEMDWLVNETEQYCKRQALFNAIMGGAELLSQNKDQEYGSVLDNVQTALSVSFNNSIGHDYIEDVESRFEYYHSEQDKMPTGIEALDKVLNGGLGAATLTVFMAPTGVGKTLIMCDMAAKALMNGHNVFYITLEMSAQEISKRIDANLLDVDINRLGELDKTTFMNKFSNRVKHKAIGKLVVEQYPTSSAHVGHFRYTLSELLTKKKFKPDLIFVDYLNIAATARSSGKGGSYETAKFIAEDIRGLGVEQNIRMVTATQVNREGAGNSDYDLTNTSESWGVPQTADYQFGLISTEQMELANKLKIKQLKNRYGDIVKTKSILVGIDRSKMRIFDIENDDDMHEEEQEVVVTKSNIKPQREIDKRFESLMMER